MSSIAIFYHCLFFGGNPTAFLPSSETIVKSQMNALKETGLLDASSYLLVGVNGSEESQPYIEKLIPKKAEVVMHGLKTRNENKTIIELEKWLPCHDDWLVLYFHSKGATHKPGDDFTDTWRNCMMRHNITHWRRCVKDLEDGFEVVGCHYMEPPATPPGQYIFAGTFWWARANYLLTLPPLTDRSRIVTSGIESIESRYEAEVWIGNGPYRPKIKDYHGPDWNPSKIATCKC